MKYFVVKTARAQGKNIMGPLIKITRYLIHNLYCLDFAQNALLIIDSILRVILFLFFSVFCFYKIYFKLRDNKIR